MLPEVLPDLQFWSSVDLTGNQTGAMRDGITEKFWSSVDLTCNQTGTMCRLFDGEELHVCCVMMFKRELLESHYMAQGTD